MRNCSRVSCAMAAWQYWMTEDHEDMTCLLLSSLFKVRWATVEISFRSSATASPTPFTSVSSAAGAPKTPESEPNRSISALAIGLVSRRGIRRKSSSSRIS
ncbi:hypothetical protein ACVIEO_002498 [Rhizobium leguminosarum]